MALLTTTIGAYPKPDYVKVTDWFKLGMDTPDPTRDYAAEMNRLGSNAEEVFACRMAAGVQLPAGCPVLTGPDIQRLEKYIQTFQ
jgi:hypothetical protein